MTRRAKSTPFQLRSGNSPLFNKLGDSPLHAADEDLVAAAKLKQGTSTIDYELHMDAIVIPEQKKRKKKKRNGEEEEENGENGKDKQKEKKKKK